MAPRCARVVALVGAESTGKTTLALALRDALAVDARRVTVVPEYLREFCALHRRTPTRDEQRHIADEQTRRIERAAEDSDWVIADTTALMTAVYSDLVFGDTALYDAALRDHAGCDLTLLTGLDVAWQADGWQRDGPHVRQAVDARVRTALDRSDRPYALVYGLGERRVRAALDSLNGTWPPRPEAPADDVVVRWHGYCERCGDPACERLARRRG